VIEKNKKIYAWRRSQETFMPQCLGQYGDQERQSVLSVMFWGCITYKGVGELVSVQGNMATSHRHRRKKCGIKIKITTQYLITALIRLGMLSYKL
jgi:hypothetical protein